MNKTNRSLAGFFRNVLGMALLAAVFVVQAPRDGAAEGADEPVQRLNEVLIEAMMRADQLGYQGRFDLLAPVLSEVFSFSRMAQFAVGRTWSSYDIADRQAMVDVFSRLSIAEFASRFDGFSGERFVIGGQVEGRRGLVLVESDLVKSDGDTVALNYIVIRIDGVWRIVDIRLGATISELGLKRAEYTSVLRSTDLGGLVRLLEEKIAMLADE